MHDWTLTKVEFDWRAARVLIDLKDPTGTSRSLIAEGVQDLHITHRHEWGPSASVNKVSDAEQVSSGLHRIKIEMQSGDVIQIVAQRFELPSS
jgi:hypothetical protein